MASEISENTDRDQWEFWIDRGGTFTDVVAHSPTGELLTHKLLSENPALYDDSMIQGIRDILKIPKEEPIPPEMIKSIKMGTTLATNALLERKGEPTAYVTTAGFGDALKIGYQNRPDIFARNIVLPEPLYRTVIEVEERIDIDGRILIPIDQRKVLRQLRGVYRKGIRSVAITFLHGYRYPEHEQAVAEIAQKIGFTQISVSHQTAPIIKLVARGHTTVADAYVTPLLKNYGTRVKEKFKNTQLLFMQSGGGLISLNLLKGKDAVFSGPAGGIVGAVNTAKMSGFDKIVGFDMGGTSTDVALYSGEYERSLENEIAGVKIQAPMLNIHTVAAGGGSILNYDGIRYQVGPESAGAYPGPACYRNEGPLTVTDANVMLGKIQPKLFPQVFGKQGKLAIDKFVVEEKFRELAEKIGSPSPYQVAEGFIRVAVDNMASAIKKISIRKGYNVQEYALWCFGGAGGQHACPVADALGIKTIFIHPFAGVLSAFGMGLSDLSSFREQSVELELNDSSVAEMKRRFLLMENECRRELIDQFILPENIEYHRRALIKYAGTDSTLPVEFDNAQEMILRFEEIHQERFGFLSADKRMVVAIIALEGLGKTGDLSDPVQTTATPESAEPLTHVLMYSEGDLRQTPVYDREKCRYGTVIKGPAIIMEYTSTTIVEAGWKAVVNERNHLIMKRIKRKEKPQISAEQADPIMLEIFSNLFMSIAEQMGIVLANTAQSVNIKERLDFSCAIFDSQGNLVANAPHIPVHLGSMDESVKAVIRKTGSAFKPGQVYLHNAPYNGGTHLPDITVITPVFDKNSRELRFFVAARGHHADIGGITPGSMPAESRNIEEEGVLIDSFLLVDGGVFRSQALMQLLTSGKYPARQPFRNIADFKAQIAACNKGVKELQNMIEHYGLETVLNYMRFVREGAEKHVRAAIEMLQDGQFVSQLDDGSRLQVNLKINHPARSATIDFGGSAPQHPGNLNAPKAVCKAVVLYVFRTLIERNIPLNEGCLKPITIIIPEKSILSPEYPSAVVAGNVETSQCLTDALFGAMGIMAASQGTMNNFSFGNEQFQYYETICGGAGAGPSYHGADAVHTHMTNSRLTDPEVLEQRFPIRVLRFAIRPDSGGNGKFHGGNGVIREVEFLKAFTVSILSNRRLVPPFGLNGGEPGRTGANTIIRKDRSVIKLPGTATVEVEPGDRVVIVTPGGGGYGKAEG